MKFSPPLQKGQLIRRYKRFLADVKLEASGEIVTAHCANPGSMEGLCSAGTSVWLQPAVGGKLSWRWQISAPNNRPNANTNTNNCMVGINTHNANTLVAEALTKKAIPELAQYPHIKREHKVEAGSRLDFLLTAKTQCYLEVKNVTLCRTDAVAEFPDAVTTRGQKHLEVLERLAKNHRAVLLFVVQRADCHKLKIAQDIDPDYARLISKAMQGGLEVLVYCCKLTPKMVEINRKLDFIKPTEPVEI